VSPCKSKTVLGINLYVTDYAKNNKSLPQNQECTWYPKYQLKKYGLPLTV